MKKSIFKSISASIIVTITLLLISLMIQLSIGLLYSNITEIKNKQLEFVHINNIVQKISDDLSYLSNMFILTNDDKYRYVYDEIVKIRDGELNLPSGYHSFLSKKLSIPNYNHNYQSENQNIQEYFNYLSQDNPEISFLFSAKDDSKELSNIELLAFNTKIENPNDNIGLQNEKYNYSKLKIIKQRETAENYINARHATEISDTKKIIHYLMYFNGFIELSLLTFICISIFKFRHALKISFEEFSYWIKSVINKKDDNATPHNLPSEFDGVCLSINEAIKDLKVDFDKVEHISKTDLITGLPNIRTIDDFFEVKQNEIERYGSIFEIVILNIKNLKSYNHKLGVEATNTLLSCFSNFLKENMRKSDLSIYLGSGLFMICVPQTKEEECAKIIVNNLNEILELYEFSIENHKVKVKVSSSIKTTDDNIRDTFNTVINDCIRNRVS